MKQYILNPLHQYDVDDEVTRWNLTSCDSIIIGTVYKNCFGGYDAWIGLGNRPKRYINEYKTLDRACRAISNKYN